MKEHFDKEITERPRRGGGYAYRKVRNADRQRLRNKGYSDNYEDHGQTKMRKVYGWERKEFDDHLSPLRRWLRKQVGRPWSKIWSEICQLRLGGVLGQHLKDHVYRHNGGGMVADYDEILLRREQSKKYHYNYSYRYASEYGYEGLWIDQHGILRFTPSRRSPHRRGVQEELPYVKINEHAWYAKEKGLWFRFSGIDPYPEIIRETNRWTKKKEIRVTGKCLYRRVEKHALNRKEMDKLGFNNDPPSLEKLPKIVTPRIRPWEMSLKDAARIRDAQEAADARAAAAAREAELK